MNKYKIKFVGRKLGAIGICCKYEVVVESQDPESAKLKLYDNFEHITIIGEIKEISSK